MGGKITFDELTAITKKWIEDHPVNFDTYVDYLTSDDWQLRIPFIYEDDPDA